MRLKLLLQLSIASFVINYGLPLANADEAPHLSSLHLKPSSTEKISHDYPFLAEHVNAEVRDAKNLQSTPPKLFLNSIEGPSGERLVFFHEEGEMQCGTAGCNTTIYRTSAEGEKRLADISIQPSTTVYYAKCEGSMEFFFRAINGKNDNYVQWVYDPVKPSFEFKKSYKHKPTKPQCQN